MVEIELDGRKVEAQEGSMLIDAAQKAGAYIPHFCYHKKLSVAANCRMCLVDIEKAPKPMPACATSVTAGMVVRTNSDKAVKAQKSVMEFLLINHPLDCPICDQGGECQLQDLAVGYGGSGSRYDEEKRVVANKDVGPLISMEEMSRCIHCTRCVRFGQEVAGDMELGMVHRGEHSEISTVSGDTVDSELSGNMIDICPVGALTSKPFRYSARTWELSRRKSVSPHDSTGANLTVQVKADKVMRVLPLENDAVNECWIADRDRFSYEALSSPDRLMQPMLKQGGQWQTVDWPTALEYVANGLQHIKAEHGAASMGALVSPHSTVEELYLAQSLVRGLGSQNIDYRLRNASFALPTTGAALWLGTSIASLSNLQRVVVLGSNLRKEHPLFAARIRAAARKGCKVVQINETLSDWAMPLAASAAVDSLNWLPFWVGVAQAVAQLTGVQAPWAVKLSDAEHAQCERIAKVLQNGERKALLLGNAVAHHEQAAELLTVANWIGVQTGATVGFLTEAANTVGAQQTQAVPGKNGLNASQMLDGKLKAAILLGVEAEDTAQGMSGLAGAEMVVSLSAFQTNLDVADVLLPITPFSETAGTFVNAEGRAQSFHAVVKPLGQARPAWKVLRVLGNMLGLQGFDYETAQDVLKVARQGLEAEGAGLSNALSVAVEVKPASRKPITAAMYQTDALVRRSTSLQLTQDGLNPGGTHAGQAASTRLGVAA